MRLVPLEHLKEGSVVAVDVVNIYGVPLVCDGEQITQKALKILEDLALTHVYIDDEFCVNKEKAEYSISQVADFHDIIKSLHEISDKISKGISNITELEKVKIIAKNIVKDVIRASLYEELKIVYEPVKLHEDVVIEQSIYVSIMSVILGAKLNFRQAQLVELCLTGLMRNFALIYPKIDYEGKVLEGDELERMHPVLTHHFLNKNYDISINILEGVLHHHELHDGTGYPNNLKGDDIHIYAKIISIVNFFYKLKSNNDPLVVKHGILEVVFKGKLRQFDPKVVDVFLESVELFSLDTLILLTSGDIGVIIKNNRGKPFRPVVKIIKGSQFTATKIVDLSEAKYSGIKINTVVYYID